MKVLHSSPPLTYARLHYAYNKPNPLAKQKWFHLHPARLYYAYNKPPPPTPPHCFRLSFVSLLYSHIKKVPRRNLCRIVNCRVETSSQPMQTFPEPTLETCSYSVSFIKPSKGKLSFAQTHTTSPLTSNTCTILSIIKPSPPPEDRLLVSDCKPRSRN